MFACQKGRLSFKFRFLPEGMAREFLLCVSCCFGMLLRMSPQKHHLIKRVSFCGDQILSSYKEFYWSNMYFLFVQGTPFLCASDFLLFPQRSIMFC